ncbi:MAG: peptidoglycan -binding protein [Alphaproteobacteria bacterium]|nr:peptidoglycan -binding protein [Alphaproteobacteria bacterium]
MASGSRSRNAVDMVWPAFVDGLANLIMVFLFLLLLFVIGQVALGNAIIGRDRALERLNAQIDALARTLALERNAAKSIESRLGALTAEAAAAREARDQALTASTALAAELTASRARIEEASGILRRRDTELAVLEEDIHNLREELGRLLKLVEDMNSEIQERERDVLAREREIDARDRVIASRDAALQSMSREVAGRDAQIAQRDATLSAHEREIESRGRAIAAKDAEIATLGERLNRLLLSRVEELARYRSEFFGRLRQVIGERPDIRIVGDRFVFQSEVLFATGSAALGDGGKQRLGELAATLKEIGQKVPREIDWVLRIDGHTDQRPIRTPEFPSNMELSAARAIAVSRFLAEQGLPARRLVPAAFADNYPIDPGSDEAALSRNRRIEFKLDQR